MAGVEITGGRTIVAARDLGVIDEEARLALTDVGDEFESVLAGFSPKIAGDMDLKVRKSQTGARLNVKPRKEKLLAVRMQEGGTGERGKTGKPIVPRNRGTRTGRPPALKFADGAFRRKSRGQRAQHAIQRTEILMEPRAEIRIAQGLARAVKRLGG